MGRILSKYTRMYKMPVRSGFLLGELLFTLLTVSLLVPVSVLCIRLNMAALDFDESVQDEIASAQLRRILALSDETRADQNTIHTRYLGRDMTIVYGNGHVYMTPGTQIFYSQLDKAWFDQEGNILYVYIQRKQSVQRIAIGFIT